MDRGISQSADENFAKRCRPRPAFRTTESPHCALGRPRLDDQRRGLPRRHPRGSLQGLPVPKLQDTRTEKARMHALYDRLLPFACQPLTSADPDGRQRFRGPAHRHV